MKRVGIFVDISNIYMCLRSKYQRKLDYKKLMNYVNDFGEITVAIAYGAQVGDQAKAFIYYLSKLGFETKYKEPKTHRNPNGQIITKANWDIQIAMDILDHADNLDVVIILSADGDFIPCLKRIKENGKIVIVIGSTINNELHKVADSCIEIPEVFLEGK